MGKKQMELLPGTVAPAIRSAVRAESAGVRIDALEPLAAHVEHSYWMVRWESTVLNVHAGPPARRGRALWRDGVSRCPAHAGIRVAPGAGRPFERRVRAHFARRHEDRFSRSGLGDTPLRGPGVAGLSFPVTPRDKRWIPC